METIAPIVPIEVPVATARKEEMIKTPAVTKRAGIRESPRLTVASTPPIAPAVEEKAPASRKIISIVMIPSSPAPLAKIENFSLILPLLIRNATSTAIEIATTDGNW